MGEKGFVGVKTLNNFIKKLHKENIIELYRINKKVKHAFLLCNNVICKLGEI